MKTPNPILGPTKVLIVGMAPSRKNGHHEPLEPTMARLRKAAGITKEQYDRAFIPVNLFKKYPGKHADGKRDRFNVDAASKRFNKILSGYSGDTVILLGRQVCEAYLIWRTFPLLRWAWPFEYRQKFEFLSFVGYIRSPDEFGHVKNVWLFPHPSGRNHWWNKKKNLECAASVFRQMHEGATRG